METSLRIVLLLLAAAIIAGIIWDAFWSKRRGRLPALNSAPTPKFKQAKKNPFAENHAFHEDEEQEDFEDVILIKPNTKVNPKENEKNTGEETVGFDNVASTVKAPAPKKEAEFSSGTKNKKSGYANDLVILNIMARQPGVFLGKKLFDAFHEANLFYGEMNIFHRHENIDGGGRVMFSVASAIEPGTFEISKMEAFVTPGLTLFFTIDRPNQSIAAFELMLRTAKQLAMRLDAEIRDDEHKFLTLQIIEKYRERVRLGRVAVR